MLYRDKAVHSEGPKWLRRSRIGTVDLNWPKGFIFHTIWHRAEGILKRVGIHLSLLLHKRLAGHWALIFGLAKAGGTISM